MRRHLRRLAGLALVVPTAVVASMVATPAWSSGVEAQSTVVITEPYAQCCELAERINPPVLPDTVGIVGDSLFVGITDSRYIAGPSLQHVLQQREMSTWVSTRVAMTIGGARQVVRTRSALLTETELVVVGLGTNDIFNTGRSAPDEWAESIRELIDEILLINPDAHVVWVDLAFDRFAQRAADFNVVLRQIAAESTAMSVCDWSNSIAAHPEWLGGDRLHLSGKGYRERRNVVLDCVAAW